MVFRKRRSFSSYKYERKDKLFEYPGNSGLLSESVRALDHNWNDLSTRLLFPRLAPLLRFLHSLVRGEKLLQYGILRLLLQRKRHHQIWAERPQGALICSMSKWKGPELSKA